MTASSLRSLYFLQPQASFSPIEEKVEGLLRGQKDSIDDLLETCQWKEPYLCEEIAIHNWKRLLTFNLYCDLAQLDTQAISAKIHLFERHPWNQSSQYFRAIVAINHALAKMPVPEVAPHVLESGAALIELHEYCPWLSLPYTPEHFEFGIYLGMLAKITKRTDFQEILVKMASWQLNTLDLAGNPSQGLFAREKKSSSLQLLALSFLLFKSAALVGNDPVFLFAAKRSFQAMTRQIEHEQVRLDPLWILADEWIGTGKEGGEESVELPENIYDPSTALVGFRSSGQQVFCTLHGEHTGLGSYRYRDVEIVNYGPQYWPLEKCEGFGIEGNALTDTGMRRSSIEWKRPGFFTLKGCVRMVDEPSSSSFLGSFRGIWLDMAQEFKRPHLYLKMSFLALDGWNLVAFSFFVKAAQCHIQSQTLRPCSLDKYEGDPATILFEGKEGRVELRSLSCFKKVEVIPLAGGNNFWGADFLVAYSMIQDQREYQWHIGPRHKPVLQMVI